jgi:hypothetical protein
MRAIFRDGRYANVTATLALVVAFSGTAYAANAIRSRDIVNGQVKRADLAANAVTSAKVRNGSLLPRDFKKNSLPVGPQGAKGDAGATGAQGIPGAPGEPGPATGPASGVLSGSYPAPGFAAGVDRLVPVAVVYVTAEGTVASEAHRAPVTGPPTASKDGAGVYDVDLPGITFFFSDDAATCSSADTAATRVGVNSISGSVLRVVVRDTDGTLVDGPIYCAIYNLE